MELLPRHLSQRGAAFIARFEGFRANWYKDPVGVRTIGYGHTGPLPPGFTAPLSEAEGLALLRHDAWACETAVRAIRPPIIRQTRFDALCSLAFNLGPGILGPSHTIGRDVRTWNRKGVGDDFLLYDHAGGKQLPGLVRRRLEEKNLWLHGNYG